MGFRMPAENLHECPGFRRRGDAGFDRSPGFSDPFDLARLGGPNSAGEFARVFGPGHHGIRQANPKRLLQTQEQLHPFEAADSEIAVKGIEGCDWPLQCHPTQFGHEPADHIKHPGLDHIETGFRATLFAHL